MIRLLTIKEYDKVAMGNLIKRIRKKDEVQSTLKIYEIPTKSMDDVLRPIYILSNIIGLRVFEFPRGHSRPMLSFVYSMSLCFLCFVNWLYNREWNTDVKIYQLERIINYILMIVNHTMILVILMMGLYQSEVSPKNSL